MAERENLLIGCLADDFTGASDAASFIKKGGLRTVLVSGDGYGGYVPDAGVQAVVVALKTRSVAPDRAIAETDAACEWLLSRGAEHIYFKYCSTFDSTDSGNIGPVTDALMEKLGCKYTVLCPALPVNGRAVRDGILYVNGVPLAESHMKDHPTNPMTRSSIRQLMEPQSRFPCVELHRDELMLGGEHAQAVMDGAAIPAGHATAVPDYFEDEHGSELAELFGGLPLLTGGSGLLEHLARRYSSGQARENDGRADAAARGGRRVILAGSCSAMTLRQVGKYESSGAESVKIYADAMAEGRQTVDELKARLHGAKGDILIYSSAPQEEVSRGQRLCGKAELSGLLERAMGELAVEAVGNGCRDLVVAGGETSGAVMRALGYSAFEIGRSVAPGVPEMTTVEEPRIRLVLKSGNFGGEDFFLEALREE